MGKKAALATMGTGTAAAATTTAYALSNIAGEYYEEAASEEPEQVEAEQPTQENSAGTEQVEVQSQVQAQVQVSDAAPANSDWLTDNFSAKKATYFKKGMAFENSTFDSSNAATGFGTGDDYFGDFGAGYVKGDFAKVKSNLKIKSTKYKCSGNDKWGGELTWFWSFENQKTNKGFITFNTAKTDATNKRLVLTGVFYTLEKEGGNWKVKYKQEVKGTDKYLDAKNFKRYFPKPYWYTQAGKFDKLYYTNWDFIKDEGELNFMCDEGENQAKETRTGEWQYKSSAWWETHWGWWGFEWYNHVYDWAGDHNNSSGVQWFEHMYGNEFQLEDHLGSFYVGTWYPTKAWGKGT